VVTLVPAGGAASGAIRFDWAYRMAQQNQQFDPFVLIVPQGAVVSFPNLDSVRHQVYSFSPAHPFELKLYGKDQTRTVRFDKPGVIALGCNIHDSMVAFIKVVDTPFAAKAGASGDVLLRGAPAGAATLRIWHPYLKAPGNEIVRQVMLPRDGGVRESATLELRTPPMSHMAY
jgi:plastocyanin